MPFNRLLAESNLTSEPEPAPVPVPEPSADDIRRAMMPLLCEYNSAKLHMQAVEAQLVALAKRLGMPTHQYDFAA